MSRNRERAAIDAVPCPVCGAERGTVCRLRTATERATALGRLLVHRERRDAWSAWKRRTPIDAFARAEGGGARGVVVLVSDRAQSAGPDLLAAHATRESPAEWRTDDVRVALAALRAAGWHVE